MHLSTPDPKSYNLGYKNLIGLPLCVVGGGGKVSIFHNAAFCITEMFGQ